MKSVTLLEIAIALVVKNAALHTNRNVSSEKMVALYQFFIYVLNFVFTYETLVLRTLANASVSKKQAGYCHEVETYFMVLTFIQWRVVGTEKPGEAC